MADDGSVFLGGSVFTREEILDRAAKLVTESLPKGWDEDDERNTDDLVDRVTRKVRKNVHTAIDDSIDKFTKEVIEGRLLELVKSWSFETTSKFGEKKGEPVTISEYIIDRIDKHINEAVDCSGATRSDRD